MKAIEDMVAEVPAKEVITADEAAIHPTLIPANVGVDSGPSLIEPSCRILRSNLFQSEGFTFGTKDIVFSRANLFVLLRQGFY